MNPQHRKYALIAGVAVVVVALSWGMFAALSWLLRSPVPGSGATGVPAVTAPAGDNPAAPRINATLYFASQDGQRLVSAQQEVPLGGSVVEQARAILEAQFAAKPQEPLTSTIPEGTAVRGIYVSSQNDVFVDLEPTVRSKHPGGSMQELLTVYTIVNALLTNLPTLQQVQILIDGREADTLAGHVDLRRPLKKNDSLLATPP
ncbi:MAG: GerMN domain-containing protein [Vicinamibacterales bacterium]